MDSQDKEKRQFMDQHRQFRLNHSVPSTPNLGQPKHRRLPFGTPPVAREACEHGEISTDENEFISGGTRGGGAVPVQPTGERICSQVKQLQFWLKVFSRFCQDDAEKD